jgi:hypothetical protein
MGIAKAVFFVESEEENELCPNCGNVLMYHCRVIRTVKDITGVQSIYSIRVLTCRNEACPSTYHRELPDIIVPYRRYDAESMEEAIDREGKDLTVACDESTIRRWRKWFETNATNIMMALMSIIAVMENHTGASSLATGQGHLGKPIQRIKEIVGRGTKWLNETVRTLVNSSKWVFNRSAFLTG